MAVYVIAGGTAGIGGISYAAIYTTVLPSQGQGFELYAIAAAVIGGTSLAGGIGTIWGTIIGVFIMSVLATGLPSLNLEAHWQTFFTGVIVIGAVLLDMSRNKKASEVRIETPADIFKRQATEKIEELRKRVALLKESGDSRSVAEVQRELGAVRGQLRLNVRRLRSEYRAEQARIRAEERAADHEFAEMLKARQVAEQEEPERNS